MVIGRDGVWWCKKKKILKEVRGEGHGERSREERGAPGPGERRRGVGAGSSESDLRFQQLLGCVALGRVALYLVRTLAILM